MIHIRIVPVDVSSINSLSSEAYHIIHFRGHNSVLPNLRLDLSVSVKVIIVLYFISWGCINKCLVTTDRAQMESQGNDSIEI